jgi:hypothetical protein
MTPTSVAAYLKRRRWNTPVMSVPMQDSLQRVTSNELGKEQKDTYPYLTFHRRKHGKLYGTRVLGVRNPRSSRSTGKLCTWRRGNPRKRARVSP